MGAVLTGASLPVLCLGCMIHTQEGTLPRPSISAVPGSVIPRGQPVTVVCRGPAGAEIFRLERENKTLPFKDSTTVSQPGASATEARFHIEPRSLQWRRETPYISSHLQHYSSPKNWHPPSGCFHSAVFPSPQLCELF
uniref:Uncharacterized protein n=1 Tax=Prolemur simus TaxID=1328070 RepID=A0A8C9DGB9_PROSS